VADVENLCPWCIADGRAAKKWDGFFNELANGMALPDAVREEVCCRTPAIETWQDWSWPSSTTDALRFVGEVDGKSLLTAADERAVAACLAAFEGWGGTFTRDDLRHVSKGSDPALYLFQDFETGAYTAIADAS